MRRHNRSAGGPFFIRVQFATINLHCLGQIQQFNARAAVDQHSLYLWLGGKYDSEQRLLWLGRRDWRTKGVKRFTLAWRIGASRSLESLICYSGLSKPWNSCSFLCSAEKIQWNIEFETNFWCTLYSFLWHFKLFLVIF